jgi:hypothetical protein
LDLKFIELNDIFIAPSTINFNEIFTKLKASDVVSPMIQWRMIKAPSTNNKLDWYPRSRVVFDNRNHAFAQKLSFIGMQATNF